MKLQVELVRQLNANEQEWKDIFSVFLTLSTVDGLKYCVGLRRCQRFEA